VKYLLDTDHLVIIQRRSQPEWTHLRTRLADLQPSDFVLCSVTFHEQILGAHAFINRSTSSDQLVRGYRMLERSLADANNFTVLPFDRESALLFDHLRRRGIRIGTMDLRVAAVALRHGLTVLTRNTVDFVKVPDLHVADWSRA
jgi:tRNA(fMet)-specific endonuclease VapC